MRNSRTSAPHERARTLAAQGDLDEAASAYADLIATEDEQHVLQPAVELAQLFAGHGQLKRACAAYRTAIPLIRLADFVRGTIQLAEILEEHGDFEGAVAAYQEVVHQVGGVDGAVYPAIYLPAIRARAARVRANTSATDDLVNIVADGPDIPPALRSGRNGERGAVSGSAGPGDRTSDAEIAMLIGCGELTAAEALIHHYAAQDSGGRSWRDSAWAFEMLRICDVRGDRTAMRKYLDQYAVASLGSNDSFINELREGLERVTPPGGDRAPLFPWGGESDPLGITYINNPHLTDAGLFFRPLPRPAKGQVRFVMLGGPMCYVDSRGEHSCADPADTSVGMSEAAIANDSAQVHALTDDPEWAELGAELSHRLLNAAQRCGAQTPWAFATGIATKKFRQKVKSLGQRIPTKLKPSSLVLDKPPRGVWLYHPQPGTFVLHQHSKDPIYRWSGPRPSVGWWRTPDRSDLILQGWCDTLGAESDQPITIILPDTPMLRDFARRYVRQQTMDRIERTYLENAVHFAGFKKPAWEDRRNIVCYRRFRPSLVIDSDGVESDGDLLTAALDYLEIHHELRISPFDALRDPLLSALLSGRVESLRASRAAQTRWRSEELKAFQTAKSWFEVYHNTKGTFLDLYAVHSLAAATDD